MATYGFLKFLKIQFSRSAHRCAVFSTIVLTTDSDVETAALLCSTIAGSYPRDTVPANREWIILVVIARRHCHVLHVGSWKLPFVSQHHC